VNGVVAPVAGSSPCHAAATIETAANVTTPMMTTPVRMTDSPRPSPRAPPIAAGHRPIPPFGGAPFTLYLSGKCRSVTDSLLKNTSSVSPRCQRILNRLLSQPSWPPLNGVIVKVIEPIHLSPL